MRQRLAWARAVVAAAPTQQRWLARMVGGELRGLPLVGWELVWRERHGASEAAEHQPANTGACWGLAFL